MLFLSDAISIVQITMIIVWIAVIIGSIIIEAETVQLVSLWFGIGAIPALICAAFKVPWYIQLIVFVVVSGGLLALTRPLVKKITKGGNSKTNVDSLIDDEGIVTKEIGENEAGEVKVHYQTWGALSKRHIVIKEGQKVIVQQVIGNKLIVDIIEEISIK